MERTPRMSSTFNPEAVKDCRLGGIVLDQPEYSTGARHRDFV